MTEGVPSMSNPLGAPSHLLYLPALDQAGTLVCWNLKRIVSCVSTCIIGCVHHTVTKK